MSVFGWYRPWLAELFDSCAPSRAKVLGAALAIAERDGVVRKATGELARLSSLDPTTVRSALADLERGGWLRRRRSRDYVEVTLVAREQNVSQPRSEQNGDHARSRSGATPDRNGRQSRTRTGTSPDTSTSPTQLPENARATAEQLLARFNDLAGTSYEPYARSGRPAAPLQRILEALTELDGLSLELGERMIRHALADPFWAPNPAQPGHVFGQKVRTSNFEAVRRRAPGRSGAEAFIDRHDQRASA